MASDITDTELSDAECYLCGRPLDARLNVGPVGRGGVTMRNLLCLGCGLVEQSPLPSEAELRRYYEESFAHDHYDTSTFGEQAARIAAKQGERLGPVLAAMFPERGIKAADVGCGLGGLAALCRDRYGADIVGVEMNRDEAEFARREYDLNVIGSGIEDWVAGAERGAYGALVLSHVLEHLRDPVGALSALRALLRDGGRIYIEVPNVMYPSKDLDLFFRIPHLWNFTPRTLVAVATKAGLSVESVHGERSNKIGLVCVREGGTGRDPRGLPGSPFETILRLGRQRAKTAIRKAIGR